MAAKKAVRGVNPQEATIPEEIEGNSSDESPTNNGVKKSSSSTNNGINNTITSNQESMSRSSKKKPNGKERIPSKKKRRKKRDRVVHVASVQGSSPNDDNSKANPSIPLPPNHYQTELIRRAIRKQESSTNQPSPKTPIKETQDEEEVYGDISLGMKLSVVGGKVIVQHLNPLADGRASPAQVVGVIQRGDVLLSINNLSLVNLPIDLLMDRLKPLSAPDATGAYDRILYLRLAAGEGLELLRKYEAAEARKYYATDEAASEVFSLFPMVDQLSGMPMFENSTPQLQRSRQHQEEKNQTESTPIVQSRYSEQKTENTSSLHLLTPKQSVKTVDDTISRQVAEWRSMERKAYTSEFFAWNDNISTLLRPQDSSLAVPVEANTESLTKSEVLELGRTAILGAASLCSRMEDIDRGKDMRSFRSWNSSISLRSRASTRRKFVLDAASLPAMKCNPRAQEGASQLSDASTKSDMEEVDGDALLLRLAAHDEIWRNQVIECLKNARDKLNNGESESSDEESKEEEKEVDAITKELGAFLFGETMAKIITKKKKSKALPPSEITAVLFDLSTNLASKMPDEIAVGDRSANGTLKSSLVPFTGRMPATPGSSVILATRFVLDEALAIWLKTFRPLPWESRRVLWPYVRSNDGIGTGEASRFSDNDSLTVDSDRSSPKTAHTSNTNRTQTKDLRQQIEDQELDVETRAETCFLVTYYLTQRLLPKATSSRTDQSSSVSEVLEFVKAYGAYMKLPTSLAYAAAWRLVDVVNVLLELAEYDLKHKEMIKLFTRRSALILYEPTMLSAVVQCLPRIKEESSANRRQQLVDICVSAYPDVCPWQVSEALLQTTGGNDVAKRMKDLYYYYLSSLLHPQDGSDAARKDPALVEEWCILSLENKSSSNKADTSSRRNNFLSVASRSSSDHLVYKRDLVMLMKLSMASQEYDLALELAGEIVESPSLSSDASVLSLLLRFLREITQTALDKGDQDMLGTLKRFVRLLHEMSVASRLMEVNGLHVSDELRRLLEYKEKISDGVKPKREVLDLVHFLANEANPTDFLEALSEWTGTHEVQFDMLAVLQSVLERGTRCALNSELSGSLLRLRRARRLMDNNRPIGAQPTEMRDSMVLTEVPTIWSLMAQGLVPIDK